MYYSDDALAKIVDEVHASLYRYDTNSFGPNTIFDPYKAVKAFNGTVCVLHDRLNRNKNCIVHPTHPYASRGFIINIPSGESPTWSNMHLAHALGHAILHYRWADKEEWTRRSSNRHSLEEYSPNLMEREANMFARLFLLPKHLVEREYNKKLYLYKSQVIHDIGDTFRVPYSTAEIRLVELGIL